MKILGIALALLMLGCSNVKKSPDSTTDESQRIVLIDGKLPLYVGILRDEKTGREFLFVGGKRCISVCEIRPAKLGIAP